MMANHRKRRNIEIYYKHEYMRFLILGIINGLICLIYFLISYSYYLQGGRFQLWFLLSIGHSIVSSLLFYKSYRHKKKLKIETNKISIT